MADWTLVNTLKEARTRLGWTQGELAVRVSVSRKTINTVENGVFTPSVSLALRLAEVLGEPVERLFRLQSGDPRARAVD